MRDHKLVSVIIPTKNSARFLKRCIESVRAQRYPRVQIVVVDNKSNDGTWQIAQSLADIAIQGGPERSAQCNAGARKAAGELLYRVDADFVVDERVVSEAAAACESGADAVCVPNRSDPAVSFWSSVRNFERRMYEGEPLVAGARFFRRQAFDAIGGFDETLIAGEDYDFNNRLEAAGFKIVWIGADETHLGEPETLGEIARKSYFYGRTFAPFLRKSGSKGIAQINPLRPTYARHWRDFLRHPVLGGAFLLMQIVKYACGAAGYLTSVVRPRRTVAS